MSELNINTLLGKTLTAVALSKDKDEILFVVDNKDEYKLYHEQSCCESVLVEDVCGELSDLVGSPILQAEENTNHDNPPGVTIEYQDSYTWTFYRLATIKGSVVIRWYGSSNGYYSESVDFCKL